MKEKLISWLKNLIPEPIFNFLQSRYHWLLGFLGALIYGFPSRKMIVIGVTGTKGKTTTCNFIAQILNSAGFKTGLATTVNFGIGDKKWINTTKQTMLGRFQLQKLLSKMAKQGCRYAVIETSSEGILQYRHRFIDYNIAVFTNLTPEHIERHGSFENYREAKIKLFEMVAQKENGVGIYNLDDLNAKHFLEPKIKRQYVFTLKLKDPRIKIKNLNLVSNIKSTFRGTSFTLNGEKMEMPVIGKFNVYNAVAAICVALSQGISIKRIKKALLKIELPAGRLEMINKSQNFMVIVDYAHEPASLEAVYKTLANLHKFSTNRTNIRGIRAQIRGYSRLICLLGAQGGGRDRWKRPEMGKIAAKYCDKIILTNEDPYDENPLQIINDIEEGISVNLRSHPRKSASVYKIIDRGDAIKKAISLAKKGDVVILTGKGGEVWMCIEKGKKISWNDRLVVEEILTRSKTTNPSESTNI